MVAFAMLMSSPVFAVLIDGQYRTGEGYTTEFSVKFQVEGINKGDPLIAVADTGKFYLSQDGSGNVYAAFIQPTSLVDNSYGVNSIGWGADAPSGKTHKFTDLIGSDAAQFQIFVAGNKVLDFTMDYLHGFGLKPDGTNDKNLPPFRSGGVTAGEGKVTTGIPSNILVAESSMGYNYNTFGVSNGSLFGKDTNSPAADDNYNVTDPLLAAWIFDVIYEFEIDGKVLNGIDIADPDSFEIVVVHDSPNKIGGNKVYGELEVTPVPEPATMLLLGAGLIGLAGLRTKFKKRQ